MCFIYCKIQCAKKEILPTRSVFCREFCFVHLRSFSCHSSFIVTHNHILLHFLKSNDEKMPQSDQYFFIDSKG